MKVLMTIIIIIIIITSIVIYGSASVRGQEKISKQAQNIITTQITQINTHTHTNNTKKVQKNCIYNLNVMKIGSIIHMSNATSVKSLSDF